MKLREREHENTTCRLCGHTDIKLITEESFGCDECKQPIDDLIAASRKNSEYRDYLGLGIFDKNVYCDTKELHFCSWKCLFKKLRTVKCNYFVTLPYINYEKTMPGQTVKDFLACIKR